MTTDEDEMITREEFETFKMRFELWKVDAEQRITDLELSSAERDKQYISIIQTLVRLETRQEALMKSTTEHQKQFAASFEKLTDKLTDHLISASK